MGLSRIAVSVRTAMIESVVMGTIVDSSIYLLAPFRDAFLREANYVMALDAMVRSSGRAVVFSTVTLAVGFWVGVFSSFVPTVHFAVLAGAAYLLGLISQFVLLPLSLLLFQPLGRPGAPGVPRPGGLLLAVAVVAIALVVAGAGQGQEGRRQILLQDQLGRTKGPGQHHS